MQEHTKSPVGVEKNDLQADGDTYGEARAIKPSQAWKLIDLLEKAWGDQCQDAPHDSPIHDFYAMLQSAFHFTEMEKQDPMHRSVKEQDKEFEIEISVMVIPRV